MGHPPLVNNPSYHTLRLNMLIQVTESRKCKAFQQHGVNLSPLKQNYLFLNLPFMVKFSSPHSNIIHPHFSWVGPIRVISGIACWSVSSTKVNSSSSSRVNKTLDFSKGIAVMAQVPISITKREQEQNHHF